MKRLAHPHLASWQGIAYGSNNRRLGGPLVQSYFGMASRAA
jgi:hypothetical protein